MVTDNRSKIYLYGLGVITDLNKKLDVRIKKFVEHQFKKGDKVKITGIINFDGIINGIIV